MTCQIDGPRARMPRRRRLLCLVGAVILTAFLGALKRLSDGLSSSSDGDLRDQPHLRARGATPPRFSSSFSPVPLSEPLFSSAASGLAVVAADDKWLLAVANFYGSSSLFALDPRAPGLSPRLVQQFATRAAHDWEVLSLPGGRLQLVGAEYDAPRSLVYEINASQPANVPSRQLEGWPTCVDSDPAACTQWAASGECARNPSFMHASCAASCGKCAALKGPLAAVQALDGLGGTAARHIRLPASAREAQSPSEHQHERDLLLVANYKAAAGEGVALYEWRDGETEHVVDDARDSQWQFVGHVDVPGAGEFTHCSIPQTGEQLIVASVWHTNGSFTGSSWVLAFETPDGVDASSPFDASWLVQRQALLTHGSHDAECFHRGGDTYLLLASGRHDSGRRDVPSMLYVYDWRRSRFVERQKLQTVGAHDIELVSVAIPGGPDRSSATDELLAVVANGASWNASARGDGEVCDNAVDVYRWDDLGRRFVSFQRLPVGGCATFVRAWRAPSGTAERVLLAVAVERTTTGSFDASVLVYEWR